MFEIWPLIIGLMRENRFNDIATLVFSSIIFLKPPKIVVVLGYHIKFLV